MKGENKECHKFLVPREREMMEKRTQEGCHAVPSSTSRKCDRKREKEENVKCTSRDETLEGMERTRKRDGQRLTREDERKKSEKLAFSS